MQDIIPHTIKAIEALKTEEIDLAITGLAYTPARAQQMEMSIGYNMTEDTGGQAVIISKKDE